MLFSQSGFLLLSIGSATAQVITEDSFFYGQSPPVYPSPQGTGLGDWAASYAKATALVDQMTNEEKQSLTAGAVNSTSGCAGNIVAIPRLGFTGLCLNDNGNGVRSTDYVNNYAGGLSVAASFNKELAYDRGYHMGGEFRRKGAHVSLGPVMSPIGRLPLSGRFWEALGADPWLAGVQAAESVKGVQSRGVMTCAKHLIANEQETWRISGVNTTTNATVNPESSNIDDKTMHEIYMWPFADAVRAGMGSVMCGYNRINNSQACQNSKLLNGLLKEELGFQGFVLTDWNALYGGVAGAEAGLEMSMPAAALFENLTEAVANGSMPQARLDDMATRIIATWYQLGQDEDFPEVGIIGFDPSVPHPPVNARDPSSRKTLLDLAVEGQVLVKNNGILPLKNPRMLALFGYAATASPGNNFGGGEVAATLATGMGDLAAGLAAVISSYGWILGYRNAGLDYTRYLSYVGQGTAERSDAYSPAGTVINGGGSGWVTPPYVSAPFDAIQARAIEDGTALYWDFNSTEPTVVANADACLVFINHWSTEGVDRPGLYDDYSDSIVINVASICNNTVVVVQNPGVRLIDTWVDHENISAILYTHVPGQDSGRATAALLYGDYNPSGKLPYTVARNESDYSVTEPSQAEGNFAQYPQSDFTEGPLTDYKWFDAEDISPRYEFGFGLSYTTYNYSNLNIAPAANVSDLAEYASGPIIPGGKADMWEVLYTVTARVTNTGEMDGAEVAQLYLGIPNSPMVRQLRGFAKPFIFAGEFAKVTFELKRRDLSVWNVVTQDWELQRGTYAVSVGASSRDLPLVGEIVIE